MDSFQGSIPLTFISFYLDNQTPEIGTSPNLPELPQPASNKAAATVSEGVTNLQASPRIADSNEDVNAYAEAKALSMESGKLQIREQSDINVANTELLHTEVHPDDQVTNSLLRIRASTPIPIDAVGTSQASLSTLESGLSVANAP